MKTRIIVMALALALLSLSACTKEDREIPMELGMMDDPRVPLLPLAGDFEMWPTPTIDDSDLQGEGYTFDYWRAHKDEAQTSDELMAMCNVPNDLLKNMSTPNLAWTCFNHPYNTDWSAYNNYYVGIISVMKSFNGYEELMKRKGGAEATIDLFVQLGYHEEGKINVNEPSMIAWTLVLCTASDYRAFNREQVSRLAKEVLYKDFIADKTSDTNLYLSHKSYCLLGAFMAFHYDEALPEEQLILLASFIRNLRMTYYTSEVDLVRSYTIIKESLNRLAGE